MEMHTSLSKIGTITKMKQLCSMSNIKIAWLPTCTYFMRWAPYNNSSQVLRHEELWRTKSKSSPSTKPSTFCHFQRQKYSIGDRNNCNQAVEGRVRAHFLVLSFWILWQQWVLNSDLLSPVIRSSPDRCTLTDKELWGLRAPLLLVVMLFVDWTALLNNIKTQASRGSKQIVFSRATTFVI